MHIPELLSVAVVVNSVLSCVANAFLIYLILFCTQRHMRPYSRLMLAFSIFNIFFTLLHAVVNPVIFCEGYGFVMFAAGAVAPSHVLSYMGLLIYTSAYAQSLVLLCYHFLYRHALICQVKWLNRIAEGRLLLGMTLVYALIGGGYGLNVFLFLFEDARVRMAFAESFNRTFGEDLDEIVSLGGVYFLPSTKETQVANPKSWAGLTICMLCISASFVVIVICGRQILKTLREAAMSNRTRKRQMGIFQALVVQTIVPVIFMYIPSGIVLLCPIFRIAVDTFFVTVFFGIYCTLEPLVMIYFIKDYRRALLRILHIRTDDDELNSECLTKEEMLRTHE